ncbi:MAG TPA: formylglycine-generating enzyme family protein [Candidatus Hydrogenedentes bacterium]|nr:formylglycine-generating enzyme family protein [Candidatus Hydrogenedentota bacterium]
MAFVWIPPGEFMMGSAMSPEDVYATYGGDSPLIFENEHPRHRVVITRGFWLGRYEVTQAEWTRHMPDNPSTHRGDDLPVESISWDDCQSFIAALNALGEGAFRLPTEAEWEYACRAGAETEFFFGDDAALLDDYGWHVFSSGMPFPPTTQPVGRKLPSPWNLYDIHGNVWEFCQDRYGADYYAASPEIDPQGPEAGSLRALRGGTMMRTAVRCRAAFRSRNAPSFVTADQGVRICREAD